MKILADAELFLRFDNVFCIIQIECWKNVLTPEIVVPDWEKTQNNLI